jgi:hypothetical protein
MGPEREATEAAQEHRAPLRGVSIEMGRRSHQQVGTVPTMVADIVSDPQFAAGVNDYDHCRPYPPFKRDWDYERGRLFAACCERGGIAIPYPIARTNRKLVALVGRYFDSGEIL